MPVRHHPPNEQSNDYNVDVEVQRVNTQHADRDTIKQLDKRLWAEACYTAVYIKNRLPHSALPKKITPFQAMFNWKSAISHMRPFGAKCYVHILEEKRPSGSKMDPRAETAIFIGYTGSHKIYRV